nr:saccharopine dehydrogenase [Actinomycetota bacterium]
VDDRPARRLRDFTVRGQARPAVSIGGSEHFALPRAAPGLREVNVYLGWFGPLSRPLQGLSLLAGAPGVRPALEAVAGQLIRGSGEGPGEAERAGSSSHVQAVAYDARDREVAHVVLEGPNGYDLTGRFLAWGAERAAGGGLRGTGALGPADGFGLDELEAGCAKAGLRRVDP